jgi:hypothetical protein
MGFQRQVFFAAWLRKSLNLIFKLPAKESIVRVVPTVQTFEKVTLTDSSI